MLGNPLLLGDDGYQISRSVRLRSSAGASFSRTPASSSNRRTWTWSAWVKRGQLAVNIGLFSAKQTKDDITGFYINANDKLIFIDRPGNSTNALLATTLVFRDPSAWYHIMVVVDSTQATSANRIRFFVNGVQTTQHDAATYPSQNYEYAYINNTTDHRIGAFQDNTAQNFDGYLTDINFIDGQALTPSAFGETDAITGVWKPRRYTGTYGTNGFFLNFSDPSAATAAAIGKDYSGNGNNWTPNNISVTAGATYDSMLDVPTPWADGGNGRGNYAVLNPIDRIGAASPIAGNLGLAPSGNGVGVEAYSTIAIADKSYVEMTLITDPLGTFNGYLAVATRSGNVITYNHSGGLNVNGSTVSSSTYTSGDTVSIAVDAVARTATVYKNNTSVWTGSFTASGDIFFRAALYGTGLTPNPSSAINFGQRPFAYTPPTGFRALNTQNLPEPTIVRGNRFMDATTYTGTGAAQTITNSGGFATDLVWVKQRSGTAFHCLLDTSRGAGNFLYPNSTSAEAFFDEMSFASNGFAIKSSAGTGLNANGQTYVAWQWREGATQGFDIVTFSGNGSNQNISHSLGVAPRMMIAKRRDSTSNWAVYHASAGTGYLLLNSTAAYAGADPSIWNATAPTSSVFTVAGTAGSFFNSGTFVNYLFSEVAGFSRFGSYTGNGSADGPFVFCGFRPRWVMIKRTDSTADWQMYDTARGTVNVINTTLAANLSSAESAFTSGYDIDFLSNGFKPRSGPSNAINTSGGTYIFAAFSETAFKYSLAR